ncbi:MAG: SBBP repeat-containing protein [Candidatus Aminicenantes bacterium]|nr:SBBP repeat-containing protein [Candidatus Aminicenantes bacterium]
MGKEKKCLMLEVLGCLLSLLMFFSVNLHALSGGSIAKVEKKPSIYNYGKLPLYFIRNDGQIDSRVKFYEKAAGHSIFFAEDGIYMMLTKHIEEGQLPDKALRRFKDEAKLANSKKSKTELVRLTPLNARKRAEIVAEEEQFGRVNYFIGRNQEKWKTGIPTFRKVRYREIYDGVDIVFYGNNNQLEYDIIAQPGVDVSKIAFEYEGIKDLKISEDGDLIALLPSGEKVVQKKPVIYQVGEDGSNNRISGEYRIIETGQKYIFNFSLKDYDRSKPLTIDPVLIYSTYLGGSGLSQESAAGIAVDSQGNAYVAGYTWSSDFPLKNPLQANIGGHADAFISKISASGTELIYSTYLGGSDYDAAFGIAVDSEGNAYVAGASYSSNFPLNNPVQAGFGGFLDAFIAKISSYGTELIYSTYLGGSADDYAHGIAVDFQGNAYVAGYTWSSDFPLKNPIQTKSSEFYDEDAFITKISASGTELIYSTYLGGLRLDSAQVIAVDSQGNAYVAGNTSSPDFPLKNPLQAGFGGDYDAFITKIDSSGTELIYSTYLGGSYYDNANSIAVDYQGNAYIAGYTYSSDFPLNNPLQAGHGGGLYDAFIAKISASGTELIYSTYLGGSADDYANGLAVDSQGNAYVAGYTDSPNFPLKNPIQINLGPGNVFITKISASGTGLIYSTCLGGSGLDSANSIAVDSQGNAYVAGRTSSICFPLKNPIQASYGGGAEDGFVARISEQTASDYMLTVAKTGTGSGVVSSEPPGINCGSICSSCYCFFAPGTVVVLTAIPDSDSYFAGWSGDCSGSNPVTTITMDSNKTVIATFNRIPRPELQGGWIRVSTSRMFVRSAVLRGNLRIMNSGDASTSGLFTVSYYLSNDGNSLDTLIGTQRVSLTISPGWSRTLLFFKYFANKNILTGKYLVAVIDSKNNIPEKDETNNRVIFGPLQLN